MSKKSPLLLLVALVAALMVSCGSMKNTSTVHRTSKVGGGRGDTRNFEIPSSLPPQSNALLAEAKKWIGTPYKYGGEDKRGIDCSGLVLNVYKSALDIKLPRNSGEQAKYCSPLQKNQLMPGDLIFFATGSSRKRVSHVGIYVGDGRMVHSSASSGVVVSDIESDYFVRTYAGAGSVDKYRAMISKSAQKSPAKKAASSSMAAASKVTRQAPATTTTPATTVKPAQNATASTGNGEQPYKMTPVTSLPKKVDRGEKAADKTSVNTDKTSANTKETKSGTVDKNEGTPAIGMPTVKSTQTTPTVTATPVNSNTNGQPAVKTEANETKKKNVVTASSTPAQTKSEATAAKTDKPVVKTDKPVQTATTGTVKEETATTNPVKAVTTVDTGKAAAEPTADEARKSVLGSLKEQKMDTINKK